MHPKKLNELPPWEWPENTGEDLLRFLRDDTADEADRILAARLAGELVVLDDEIARVLLELVANPEASEKLRSAAAIALGPGLENASEVYGPESGGDWLDDLEDEPISEETFIAVQDRLHDLFLDASVPDAVRRSILEASVRAPETWHEEVVADAWASGDPAWRLTAVFCMGYLPGFEEPILEALTSDDPRTHYHAVLAAGTWSVDAAWPHVARLVEADDVDKELLVAAIEGVVNIRPEEAPEILLPLLESPDEEIVEIASEALGMCDALLASDEDLDEDDFDDEGEDSE